MITDKRYISVLMLFFLSLPQGVASAKNLYGEAIGVVGYSDRNQWVGERGRSRKNALGFEYYQKFSNDYGDFLTANFQGRVSYDSHENSEDAWAAEIHNAWLEHPLGLGKAIRVGHFDPAFGLEPVLDTHGTLLQTLAPKNLGFKKDWGVGYRGMLGGLDYEIAGQLGSGMGIRRTDGSFLLSTRISTPQGEESQYGISFLYGRTLQSMQARTIPVPDLVSRQAVQRRRIGFDMQRPIGPFGFKGEIAFGDDDGTTVGGALVEFDYTPPDIQELTAKLQVSYWSHDWDKRRARDVTVGRVLEYEVNSSLTASLGYFHDFESSRGDEDRMVVLQLYYFGK